jgi:hypothetical protein
VLMFALASQVWWLRLVGVGLILDGVVDGTKRSARAARGPSFAAEEVQEPLGHEFRCDDVGGVALPL